MNKIISDQMLADKIQYLPLKNLREMMKTERVVPYKRQVSFALLIEETKRRMANNQQHGLLSILELLTSTESKLEGDDSGEILKSLPEFEIIKNVLFPSLFFNEQLGFVTAPFYKKDFIYQSDAFIQLLESDEWDVRIDPQSISHSSIDHHILSGIIILNTFYKQNINFDISNGIILRHRKTKLQRHLKFKIVQDYARFKKLKPLKKLSDQDIMMLLDNIGDIALWQKYIPAENFAIEGLIIGHMQDVTDVGILSMMRAIMIEDSQNDDLQGDLGELENLFQSFLNMPDVKLGTLATDHNYWSDNSEGWTLVQQCDSSTIQRALTDTEGVYASVLQTEAPVIISDLTTQPHLSDLEKSLVDQGIKSLLLHPIRDPQGNIFAILELSSPQAYRFSQLVLLQLNNMIALYEQGTNRFFQEANNAVQLTIQQKFTSIHPSVEWRFREVASKYYWEEMTQKKSGTIDPIVFRDVFPLYGQADIVGSSQLRNESIKADMVDHLERLKVLMPAIQEIVPFDLLGIYQHQVEAFLDRLLKGDFASSDESLIVELITNEINPLLRNLQESFPELPKAMLADYFDYLDPKLDIVYLKRKDYEESVSLLNQTISRYLSEEEDKMQKVLPHFFEKYETDGVEYNLYLGQSILEKRIFNEYYLKDFRLWQLILMCKLTRLVETASQSFPVRLRTAQLIFVYNSPLSIRFHMDEKQFDVDGAYNVRYEILKKRIDKAYIKGTDERLTQAGKIAIVWLQEKDRQEYMEYLNHLIHLGLIESEIEDLALDKMQGVEGLRSLRVAVTH